MTTLTVINDNHHVVATSKMIVLFSYGIPVAVKKKYEIGQPVYITKESHSTTTNKAINDWLVIQGQPIAIQEPQGFFETLLD